MHNVFFFSSTFTYLLLNGHQIRVKIDIYLETSLQVDSETVHLNGMTECGCEINTVNGLRINFYVNKCQL